MLLGFFSAAFPDADVLASFASPLAYLYHHRGVTHSLIMLPVWAMMLAWVWSRLRANPAGFKAYLRVSALGLGAHIAGDVITSFGTMILAPLSDVRVQWDTTFIIDPWFSAIIVAGLAFSFVWRHSRAPAVAGLLVLCGYVSFQWLQQQRAIEVGEHYVLEQKLNAMRVSALPRPVSPFNWMVIVEEPQRYHYAFVNLHRARAIIPGPDAGFIERMDSEYQPIGAAQWHSAARFGESAERALVEHAWQQAQFAFFRWFSAYPVLAQIERGNPVLCVWFQDLRFLTPGRSSWPFRYGMCRADGGHWRAYQGGEAGARRALMH